MTPAQVTAYFPYQRPKWIEGALGPPLAQAELSGDIRDVIAFATEDCREEGSPLERQNPELDADASGCVNAGMLVVEPVVATRRFDLTRSPEIGRLSRFDELPEIGRAH